MRTKFSRVLSWLVVGAAAGLGSDRAGAAESSAASGETLLLQDPSVSATDVVFVHAQDLWVAPRAGGDARRLTSHVGMEATPRISPDGRLVAFTAQYEGNTDVFVMPIDGGIPRRLTWHPGTDRVVSWHRAVTRRGVQDHA